MRRARLRQGLLCVALAAGVAAPAARAQDDSIRQAIAAQQRHAGAKTWASEAEVRDRLNKRLIGIARNFWLSAKADGLKFDNVVAAIDERNAASADFGLQLNVVQADDSNEFAVTSVTGDDGRRAWVALTGAPSGFIGNMLAIAGDVVNGQALSASGAIDPSCRYWVTFAKDSDHDGYGAEYDCAQFLSGALDDQAAGAIKLWAADLLRHAPG